MNSYARVAVLALLLVPSLLAEARPLAHRAPPRTEQPAIALAVPVHDGETTSDRHNVAVDTASLRELERSTRVTVRAFPLPGALPVDLELQRVQLIAAGARFIVVDETGEREVPMPEFHAFRGRVAGDPDSLVSLTLVDGRLSGFVRTWNDEFNVGASAHEPARAVRTTGVKRRDRSSEPAQQTMCGGDTHIPRDDLAARVGSVRRKSGIASDTLLRASIAIDTNTEWHDRFGSVAAAQSYVLDLMSQVSAIYEAEVRVQLEVSYLRVFTTSDPYTDNTTNTGALLADLKQEWDSNQGTVSRSTVHLFGTMTGGGSGIAYVDSLCTSDFQPTNSYDYGVSLITGNGGGWEKELVAHEFGHNFSSEHTHCFNPPIDTCASQTGCHQGSTTSSVGTIMSYCSQSTAVFHPRVKDERIRPAAEAAYPSCIERVEDPVVDRFVSIADFSGNSVDELAVGAVDAQTGLFSVQVFDAGTGQHLQSVGYPVDYVASELRSVGHFGGGDAAELGIFGTRESGLSLMQFRDAASGLLVSNVFFPPSLRPVAVAVSEPFPGIAAPVVAVVGTNLDVDRPQALLKRADSGALVGSYLLHPAFAPRAVSFAPALPGAAPEMLVMSRGATGLTLVQVFNPTSGSLLRNIFFSSIDRPVDVRAIEGIPGHARSVAVFGHDKTLDRMVLQVRDLSNGAVVRTILDHRSFPAASFAIVAHYAGSSAPEVAFVGEAPGSGLVLVQTRDLVGGNVLDSLFFGSSHDIRGLATLPHFSADSSDELAVLGRDRQSGVGRVQVRDAGSTSLLSNFAPTP